MFNKAEFLTSIATETKILKHLVSKLPADQADYSLGEGMRSNLELLRYLTLCGILPAVCCVENSWARAGEIAKESGMSELSLDRIPAALDRQQLELEKLLRTLSDEDLQTRRAPLPWGGEMSLGEALVNTTLKFLASYRMQFFLQLKAGGLTDLSTHNCWLGCDKPQA